MLFPWWSFVFKINKFTSLGKQEISWPTILPLWNNSVLLSFDPIGRSWAVSVSYSFQLFQKTFKIMYIYIYQTTAFTASNIVWLQIPHVTQPVIGRLYAALVDGEWHRVEVVSLKGIEVTCYFIDHGGEHDVLNARVLREIEPKFLSLAPQAKRVRLAGLEEFAISPP